MFVCCATRINNLAELLLRFVSHKLLPLFGFGSSVVSLASMSRRSRPIGANWADPRERPLSSSDDEEDGRGPSKDFIKELRSSRKARAFYLGALNEIEKEKLQREEEGKVDGQPISSGAGRFPTSNSAPAATAEAKKKGVHFSGKDDIRFDHSASSSVKSQKSVAATEPMWAAFVAFATFEMFRRGDSIPKKDGTTGGASAAAPEPIPWHMLAAAVGFFMLVTLAHGSRLIRCYRHSNQHNHTFFRSNIFGGLYSLCFCGAMAVLLGKCLSVLQLYVIRQAQEALREQQPHGGESIGEADSASASSSPHSSVWNPLLNMQMVTALCIAAGAVHRLSRVVV